MSVSQFSKYRGKSIEKMSKNLSNRTIFYKHPNTI